MADWETIRLKGVTYDLRDNSKVRLPSENKNGTNGQYLRTKGTGATEWVDIGSPTPEQVASAVEAWIAGHPEDRTTVADGAISYAKLNADLKEHVDSIDSLEDELDGLYDKTTEIYNWAKDASSSFTYNWRTGYLGSNGAGGPVTSVNSDYVRNYKAVSFGNAKKVRITPPSGFFVQAIIEYTTSTIGTASFVKVVGEYLPYDNTLTGIDVSREFTNVQGHYYAISVGRFPNHDSNTQYNTKALADSIVATMEYAVSKIDRLELEAPRIHVSKTDDSADFSTITEAVAYANQHPNTTIFVDSGVYDIIDELGGSEYTENLTSLSSYAGGLQLGNNTTIIGMGSSVKLTALYAAATNQAMTERFSIFNIIGSFRLENLELEVQNVRYCVHEDMAALDAADRPKHYVAQYINCKMKHNGSTASFHPECCIGGGTMNKSLHIIDGCYLDSPSRSNPAGYHNNTTSNNGIARVIVRDCYFAHGTMTFTVYENKTQVIEALVIGNRFAKAIIDNSSGLYDITECDNIYANQAGGVISAAIAPTEGNNPASSGHLTGSYFFLEDELHQATSDIAVGDTITVGTNCKIVPGGVTGEIVELKENISDVENAIFEETVDWKDIPLTFETGFWRLNGATDAWAKARRSTNLIQVTPSETIKVTTRISTNIAGVVFFNSSTFSQSSFVGTALYEFDDGAVTNEYVDEQVIVPEGAAYVVVQYRTDGYSGTPGLKLFRSVKNSKVDVIDEHINGTAYSPGSDFEIANLQRRLVNAEKANPFAWAAFDKSYFVFIHDDTNDWLETYAEVFHTKGKPMGAATIPENVNDTHLATLQQIVADGGEILGHYNASPTEVSSDLAWYACTGRVKKALEQMGFAVRGLIKANSTGSSTDKGQKYCQLYFDYADNHLGKTTQYNLPRTLINTHNYADLAAFKARINELASVNGIHAFGFHGGRDDEAWITAEAMGDIIDYINGKSNCEITTYSYLFDTFGSTRLLEKVKELEALHPST